MISICYMTCRNNPRFEWFIQSFKKQYQNEVPVEIIVIDGSPNFNPNYIFADKIEGFDFTAYKPKPTVWQGEYRLPKDDWFAASNARNTAILHAKGDYIVFADDLSVLLNGWWAAVLRAHKEKYIVFGAYKKVRDMVVENGAIVQHYETPQGTDHRLQHGSRFCWGDWCYGCSLGIPLEWALNVNGFDEICDGSGYEDVQFGARLQKKGYQMFYDVSMMTYECEECHGEGPVFRREDPLLTPSEYYAVKERMGITGVHEANGRTDVSHLLMDMVKTTTRKDNAWTWGNNFVLAELRETNELPGIDVNMKHWATGIPLKEM